MIDKDDVKIFVPTLNEEGNIKNTIKVLKIMDLIILLYWMVILQMNKEFAESLDVKSI